MQISKECPRMSLHTIVSDGVAGRLQQRRARAAGARADVASAVAQPPRMELPGPLAGMSMRVLETGLAVTAIATAVLIGLGR
jgi:hypothetical protein